MAQVKICIKLVAKMHKLRIDGSFIYGFAEGTRSVGVFVVVKHSTVHTFAERQKVHIILTVNTMSLESLAAEKLPVRNCIIQLAAAALGIDLPQLPLALSAPQWLEEQALADGAFGLALGLPLHLGEPPFITGSPLVTKVLTEDMKQLTGGCVLIEPDATKAAEQMEKIILEKRAGLKI